MSTAGAIEAPAVPRNIVIAVDDTDDAQQAVLWAVRNVLKFGATPAADCRVNKRFTRTNHYITKNIYLSPIWYGVLHYLRH